MGNNCCLVVLLLFTVLASVANSQQDYYCYQPVDIAILLDSSSYLSNGNFEQLKTFTKNFVTYFRLNNKGLGPFIGIVPYSDHPVTKREMINFRYSKSIEKLSAKIKKMKFDGGDGARLDLAFEGARKTLFQPNMGSRSWVPRVILAVTGTWRTWNPYLKRSVQLQASAARAEGVKVMVASVGAAEEEDRAVMQSMVASKDDVFMVRYPYGLVQVAERLVRKLCPIPSILPCPGKVDIAFIVDSSGSISTPNYNKIKYFVYSIANALNVSSSGAHVGVVIYSTFAEMKIKFTDHTSIESFQTAVYGLPHLGRFTRIDLGLILAHSMLFSPIYGGARQDVKKMAFILTDGKQNPDDKGIEVSVSDAAKPLMNDDIKTFSIGIGSEVDKNELRDMVEYDEDVITAENFDALVRKIKNITELTCEEISYSKCHYPADIAFVLDSSRNVQNADFEEVKRFVKTMAKLFRVFQYGSRGAVISYGNQAEVFMQMGAHKNYRDFINAVDRVPRIGGRRRTFTGLELAEQVLTDVDGGARRKVPKVVLLLTAGPEDNSLDFEDLKKVTKRLHARNALVVVVGIGPSLNSDGLAYLVTSSVNIFLAKSFTKLRDKLVRLTDETCKNVGPGVCERNIDLAFILDTSGSIDEAELAEAKKFVKDVAKTFKISPQKTQVALMVYSDKPRVVSKFGEIESHNELRTEVDALPHIKGKTRIDLALNMADTELFTWNGGMRLSAAVAKVAIVITDGRQTPAPDEIRLDQAAAPLLVRGVKVLSIGIGDNVDRSELNMMVDNPDKHAFWSHSYRELRVQLATIARESCSRETFAM